MDFDLDGSLAYDKIFSPNPSQLFIVSTVEQPLSPLWAFPVVNNNVNLNDGDDDPTETDTLTSSRADSLVITDPDRVILNNEAIMRLPMPVPSNYQDLTSVIKERITIALRCFIELGEKHILAQMWAPFQYEGRYMLKTCGQPFVYDPEFTLLHRYRQVSESYIFPLDDKTTAVDICGRVFRHKRPEWTPNVQYYSEREYPRLDYALTYNVRGTMALPVFEPNGQSCVGVLELILTSQKIYFAPEVDKMCKALEAVNLRSSNVVDSSNFQGIYNESRQLALAAETEPVGGARGCSAPPNSGGTTA